MPKVRVPMGEKAWQAGYAAGYADAKAGPYLKAAYDFSNSRCMFYMDLEGESRQMTDRDFKIALEYCPKFREFFKKCMGKRDNSDMRPEWLAKWKAYL